MAEINHNKKYVRAEGFVKVINELTLKIIKDISIDKTSEKQKEIEKQPDKNAPDRDIDF